MPTAAGITTTIATAKALGVFAAPDDHLAGGQELKTCPPAVLCFSFSSLQERGSSPTVREGSALVSA